MGNTTDHVLGKPEVKELFRDTYNLYLKYADADVFQHDKNVNEECRAIEEKFHGSTAAALQVSAVLRILIDYRTQEGG